FKPPIDPPTSEVSRIDSSFEVQPRGEDERHSRFHELFNLKGLIESIRSEGGPWQQWRVDWDTAERAWFRAAIHDRATLVPKTEDFCHYWRGSTTNRDYPDLMEELELGRFLSGPYGKWDGPTLYPYS